MNRPRWLIKDAVCLYDRFFTAHQSQAYSSQLENEIQWRQQPIKIFGRTVHQPRLTAFYGDVDRSYRYSGLTMTPLLWTQTLMEIKRQIEPASGEHFTSVLLNLYRDGRDSMGWHRDNEPELGADPVIASVSFGATRTFLLRRRDNHQKRVSIELESGSLLLMMGVSQDLWEHSLPTRMRVSGSRLNLTFRRVKLSI